MIPTTSLTRQCIENHHHSNHPVWMASKATQNFLLCCPSFTWFEIVRQFIKLGLLLVNLYIILFISRLMIGPVQFQWKRALMLMTGPVQFQWKRALRLMTGPVQFQWKRALRLEQRTALAVSAWPVPLFPLGFSASTPISGAESMAYWCSFMLSLGGVRHLSGLSHWCDLPICVGAPSWVVPWRRSSWAILGLVSGW